MYNINAAVKINVPKEIVFAVLRDMASYPQFMRYVKIIEVKKISEDEIISKWKIDIEGADVEWEERDVFHTKTMEMFFSMLKGDYGNYYGKWTVIKIGKKTNLLIDVNIDWHIPSFEKIIGSILEKKSKRIIRSMLAAIKVRSRVISQKACTR